MSRKMTRRKWLIAVLAALLLFPAVCFLDSLRYPRIARSAYWRHPWLMPRATVARLFPGKGVSAQAVLAHARRRNRTEGLSVRLLYLPDLPTDDKTIKNRVFGLISQTSGRSEERLFLLVALRKGLHTRLYDALAYEYRTGRLVCHGG